MKTYWHPRPAGEMAESYGEAISFRANIAGETQVTDVPLASWADLNALKAGDQDSLEVVVEVPAGKSKRGWNYKPEALQKIVGEVMSQGLPGFMGHQKPENLDTEFPQPVTHWVGAKFENGKAYFRGVVDKSADDLKRWIRAKVIRTVSIFGYPKLVKVAGEIQVVDYKPLSIDWTPLGRAGMPTRIVATGEIDDISGEYDGSGDTVTLGEKKEVVKKETYEPVGESGGTEGMNWKEVCAKLKAMLQNGEVTVQQISGEMGWTAFSLAGILDAGWLQGTKNNEELLGKVREALGVTGEMDVVAAAKEAHVALDEKKKASHTELVDQVLKEKVSGEIAQNLVRKMLVIPDDATKEQVAGEIDRVYADPSLKDALGKLHLDRPTYTGGSVVKEGVTGGGMLAPKKVAI